MKNTRKFIEQVYDEKNKKPLDNECSYGLSLEERNCIECSLSNYGLDCHNNPISDDQE